MRVLSADSTESSALSREILRRFNFYWVYYCNNSCKASSDKACVAECIIVFLQTELKFDHEYLSREDFSLKFWLAYSVYSSRCLNIFVNFVDFSSSMSENEVENVKDDGSEQRSNARRVDHHTSADEPVFWRELVNDANAYKILLPFIWPVYHHLFHVNRSDSV